VETLPFRRQSARDRPGFEALLTATVAAPEGNRVGALLPAERLVLVS
jgi:hypothetical protein